MKVLPSRGGNGGRRGRRMRATNLPPTSAQMKRVVTPKRLPPGRHSFSVMDHTAPKRTATKRTEEDTNIRLLMDPTHRRLEPELKTFRHLPLVTREARRPLGGHGQNLLSRGQHTTGGSVLVPASTTGFRGIK